MNYTKTTRAVLLSAMVAAVTAALPTAGVADGHTGDFAGNKGFVGDKGFVGHVPAFRHDNRFRRMVKKRTYAQAASATSCPPHFYGMYRGTMLCQDGEVVQ